MYLIYGQLAVTLQSNNLYNDTLKYEKYLSYVMYNKYLMNSLHFLEIYRNLLLVFRLSAGQILNGLVKLIMRHVFQHF